MNNQELRKIFSDKEFVKSLINMETGEEVKKALFQHGVPVNDETLKIFAAALVQAIESRHNPKMIEDSVLNSVSGGKIEINNSEEYINYKYAILKDLDSNLISEIPQTSWVLKETNELK